MSLESYIWDLGEKQRGPLWPRRAVGAGQRPAKHEGRGADGRNSRQGTLRGETGDSGGSLSSLSCLGLGAAKQSQIREAGNSIIKAFETRPHHVPILGLCRAY